MQSQVDVKDLWSVLKESDNKRNSTVALVQTIDSKGKDVWITKIPKVTAESLFLGYWKTNATNTLNSTKFGVKFDNSLGKPVAVKGWYKYESGKDYYTCEEPYTKIVTRLLKQKDKNLWIDSLLKYRFIKQMSLMTLNMKIV